MKQYFSCKHDVNIEDLCSMNPYLLKMFSAFVLYCHQHNLPCVVTSLLEDVPGRVSRTHKEGRAFDASVKGWTELHIHRVVKQFSEEFEDIGAISSKDGKVRPVVYHKIADNAYHFHFQVRPGLLKE